MHIGAGTSIALHGNFCDGVEKNVHAILLEGGYLLIPESDQDISPSTPLAILLEIISYLIQY